MDQWKCPVCGGVVFMQDSSGKRTCLKCLQDEAGEKICECNKKRNAEMVCKILNADREGKILDVVHVVRCKNCVHRIEDEGACSERPGFQPDDGFCERGEEEKTVSRKCGEGWQDGAKNL